MTTRACYADGEIGLVATVLSECMRDFRKAVRKWKRSPSEETKKEVNRMHEVIIRNRFAPYVPIDLEDTCWKEYLEEIGGVDAHQKAVRIGCFHSPKNRKR